MEERPINVLLADDDDGFLASLRELVDRQPELRVVAAARNGVEAVAFAAEWQPDAAVVDLHMPYLDGVAAIARLRQDHPTLCLIALTADQDPELHRAVRQAGADAVLQKGEMVGLLIERLTNARRSP
jgi:DNA-binding NarL/FixJ family response regulator